MRMPLGLALALALPGLLAAAGSDAVDVKGTVGYNAYQSSDGVQVRSPQVDLTGTFNGRSALALNYGLDAVSAASFDYARAKSHNNAQHPSGQRCQDCHSSVDALSGASRNYQEQRQVLTLSGRRRIGDTQAKVSWYHSDEHDYRSESLHVAVDQDLAGRDATVSLDLGHQADWLGSMIDPGFGQGRYSNEVSLAWTQLTGPRTEFRAVLDYQATEGYLADPYNFVFVDSPGNTATPLAASAPNLRERWDFALTFKQAFDWKASAEAGWRYYQDTWEVQANTLSLSYAQQWGDWVLQPEYRYYIQSAASFFRNDYTQFQPYMTRDLKLAAFSSHWLGLDLRGPLYGLLSADLRYGHYLRQDSLDYSRYFADSPLSADTWQLSLSLR